MVSFNLLMQTCICSQKRWLEWMNLYQKKVQKKGKEAQVANHDNKEYLAAENGETK